MFFNHKFSPASDAASTGGDDITHRLNRDVRRGQILLQVLAQSSALLEVNVIGEDEEMASLSVWPCPQVFPTIDLLSLIASNSMLGTTSSFIGQHCLP